jgi:hypothetical protein
VGQSLAAERARGGASRGGRRPSETAPGPLGLGSYLLLYGAYLGALLVVYGPALEGPFVSDDVHYVAANPYVHEFGARNTWIILQPYGASTIAVVNYAPVQMLIHNAAWQVFEAKVVGHHVVNLLFHGGASLLLLPVLCASGLPLAAALIGSLFFLLHPANVEAVAWISQLKSSSALFFSLAALLAHPRRPALGAVLFAVALLAKASAAYALPVAFLLEWARSGRVRRRWLAVWIGVFAVYAIVEFTAHQRSGVAETTLYDSPLVLIRTMAALAARYLAMASTSWGLSAFHEPEPAWSWLDPWWLASIPALGLLGWRLVVVLRRRREESAYWIWALVSFAPVSQIFPFLYPLADRYLYFILPGLIGGTLLAGMDAAQRIAPGRRLLAGRAAVAAGASLCLLFAIHSRARAEIWRSPAFLLADAARHYPDGVAGHLARAKRAVQAGDVEAAVAEIRGARERGFNRYEQLLRDPVLSQIQHEPAFVELVREMAAFWIESGSAWESPTQMEHRKLASAYAIRGDRDEAVRHLRAALEVGGPLDAEIRDDLRKLGAKP